jgi:hypothetical protein
MPGKFSYEQKSKALIPALVVGLLLCWFLAFNKTFDAVALNRKLNDESLKASEISFNPVYVKRKLSALDKILKGYKVDEHWRDRLWIQSSAIAAGSNAGLDFTLSKPTDVTDSTEVGESQSLFFHSNYINLVKLTDSLERIKGIGKIMALQIKASKSDMTDEPVKKCTLKLDFKGLVN